MIRFSRTLPIALALLCTVAAQAAPPMHPAGNGKMVLVGLSGLEDVQRMTAPLRHAAMLKRESKLKEIVVVLYGRAVAALNSRAPGVPEEARKQLDAARQAGVHVFACEHSLEQLGIPLEALPAGVEHVPHGIFKIAELVGEGYAPMQY